MQPLKGNLRDLRLGPGRVRLGVFLQNHVEIAQDTVGEQGLGHDRVHPGALGLFQNVVPVVAGHDDDAGPSAVKLPHGPR